VRRACARRSLAVLALALCFGLASATALSAATLDARSLAFVPIRYFAGDEVVAQATILPEDGEKLVALDLRPGSGLGVQGGEADPEIRGLVLAKTPQGWQLTLRFVPWSPGSLSVPEMRLRGLRIPALPYTALSLLGPEDREPSPPRPQRDPPGIILYLYGLAGLLLVLVLGALGSAAYLIPSARALLARRRAALAYKRLVRSLDYLAAEAGSADPASYLAALLRALRLYLAARALPEAEALTAPELAALPESALPAPATKDRAAALVARSDRLRYGGWGELEPALLEAAAEARAIAEANEEALRARV
jgi:hypothetical protein